MHSTNGKLEAIYLKIQEKSFQPFIYSLLSKASTQPSKVEDQYNVSLSRLFGLMILPRTSITIAAMSLPCFISAFIMLSMKKIIPKLGSNVSAIGLLFFSASLYVVQAALNFYCLFQFYYFCKTSIFVIPFAFKSIVDFFKGENQKDFTQDYIAVTQWIDNLTQEYNQNDKKLIKWFCASVPISAISYVGLTLLALNTSNSLCASAHSYIKQYCPLDVLIFGMTFTGFLLEKVYNSFASQNITDNTVCI